MDKIELYKYRIEIQGQWNVLELLKVSLALSQSAIESLVESGMEKDSALKSYVFYIFETNHIKAELDKGEVKA